MPTPHRINGAVYAFHAPRLPAEGGGVLFGRTAAVIMPADRSHDIDTSSTSWWQR